MHYVAFEDKLGGFIPREAADICKRKFGDCKDMTSIQVALYRKAGIDAYFTWIGTRHKPYTYEEVPLPITDNHMICTIKLDGKWVFLDGTDPLIPFGIPPQGIQGKEALVGIDANNYKIITVPVARQLIMLQLIQLIFIYPVRILPALSGHTTKVIMHGALVR